MFSDVDFSTFKWEDLDGMVLKLGVSIDKGYLTVVGCPLDDPDTEYVLVSEPLNDDVGADNCLSCDSKETCANGTC